MKDGAVSRYGLPIYVDSGPRRGLNRAHTVVGKIYSFVRTDVGEKTTVKRGFQNCAYSYTPDRCNGSDM